VAGSGTTSSDRTLDRCRERREQLRARLGHVPTILEPHAELARDIDAGLIGETHAGFERRLVAAHEVCGLVHVHADAVTRAMRGARQAVVLAPAFPFVKRAHGPVDRANWRAELRCFERDLLAALHRIPDIPLASGRLGA